MIFTKITRYTIVKKIWKIFLFIYLLPLYKLIDNGYITDYKKQVGRRMIRVYYHIEPSGQNRLEELTQEYLKTTQSIQAILNFDFKAL